MIFHKTFHPRALLRTSADAIIKLAFLPSDFLFCVLNRVPYRFDTRFLGYPCIRNHGRILLGHRIVLCSRESGNTIGVQQSVRLTVSRKGILSIGNGTGISGSSISVARKVQIGDRVRIGSGCLIMDNDAHPLDSELREAGAPPKSKPVRIEDDVFIGARSIILKGVTIGRSAVVGAGSVVTKDVPPRTIVAGNPARAVGVVPVSSIKVP